MAFLKTVLILTVETDFAVLHMCYTHMYYMIRKRLLILLSFFFIIGIPFFNGVQAATWALFPVKYNGNSSKVTRTQPAFNPQKPENGWETAQLMMLYLKSNYVNNVLPMKSVKKAFKESGIGQHADLTQNDLLTISRNLDADNILLTEVFLSEKVIRIQMRVYFTGPGIIGDATTISGSNFMELLGQALKQRFHFIGNSFIQPENRYHYIFGIDASGLNYNEITALSGLVGDLNIYRNSAVSVDGYGKSTILKSSMDKSDLVAFINSIRPQSTDTSGRLYPQLLNAVMELSSIRHEPNEKTISVILVSSAPKGMRSRQITTGFLRKISHKSSILILGNGMLKPQDRKYWQLQSNINSEIRYQDIIYRQKTGFSDGNSVFLIKEGDKLRESNIGEIENSHEIFLTTDQRLRFNQQTIVKTFENATEKKVVSSQKVGINYNIEMFQGLLKENPLSSEKKIRVLLLIENKPFWIVIPYSSVQDENGRINIAANKNYFFFLNLISGGRGMPFRNSPLYATILNPDEISNILLLNLGSYLKSPGLYLNKSIAETSLYIVYGKVKEIRVEKEYVY